MPTPTNHANCKIQRTARLLARDTTTQQVRLLVENREIGVPENRVSPDANVDDILIWNGTQWDVKNVVN
jgi:hypothetical protein